MYPVEYCFRLWFTITGDMSSKDSAVVQSRMEMTALDSEALNCIKMCRSINIELSCTAKKHSNMRDVSGDSKSKFPFLNNTSLAIQIKYFAV